jgi:hypothetical protein
MVQTFGTNSANDLYLGTDGNLILLTANDAILAACMTATRAQLGEMEYFTQNGMPNFESVWVGVPNLPLWQSYLLRILQSVDGVTLVSNITMALSNNILTYTADITTQYGTSTISG